MLCPRCKKVKADNKHLCTACAVDSVFGDFEQGLDIAIEALEATNRICPYCKKAKIRDDNHLCTACLVSFEFGTPKLRGKIITAVLEATNRIGAVTEVIKGL